MTGPQFWQALLGPGGVVLLGLALGWALLVGKIRIGRDVDAMIAEKDKQILAMTTDRDRWQGLHVDLLQSYQRQAVASTTLATVALGKT